MIMKKKIFFAAMAIALASCTSDDFIGENNNSPNLEKASNAIVFNTGTKATTRATKTGSDAATLLNNNFVFAGTKGTGATTFVFDQYNANYVANSAFTTESNSSNWEYVGYTPYGAGNTAISTLPSGAVQTIKYWDYNTTQYDFAAYSLGEGYDVDGDPATTTDITYATPSAIAVGNKSYTLTGTVDQLKAAYISDLVTAYKADGDYGNVVTFSFRSLAPKIRLAFYETIPGYSVQGVEFYSSDAATTTSTTPTLYTSTPVLPSGSGTMTVTFPTVGYSNKSATDYNKAHVSFAQESGVSAANTLTFDALNNYPTTYEGSLTSGSYLGRASNEATYAGGLVSGAGKYYTVLPYETGANLKLRIKYTLVSTDGSGEQITVDKATAVVPAELAKWNPNFAYTYIFKISDMTNGTTGVDKNGNPVYGLTPITLNAVVVDSEDGLQETITTVSTPSITTYTEGKVVTANDEYKTGNLIYIIVNNGTSNETLTVGTNAKLYTVTLEDGAAQELTEGAIDNALANGVYDGTAKTYTVTDAKGKKLVVTDTESTLLSASTKIEAADSPTGNEIAVTGAKFTAGATGTKYVFQYIKTARTAGVYTAVASGTTLTAGNTYYLSNKGVGEFTANGTEVADGTNFFTQTTAPNKGEYAYKIIKIQ